MSECDEQLLGAYHDGELSAADRARVEQHLAGCAECTATLQQLREASRLLNEYPFQDITPRELSRLHQVIDEEAAADEQVLFRIGGTMGLIAASILVVGFAWLRQLPPTASPTGGSNPTQLAGRPVPAWERVAITQRPDPFIESQSDVQMAEADFMAEKLAQLAQQPGRVER